MSARAPQSWGERVIGLCFSVLLGTIALYVAVCLLRTIWPFLVIALCIVGLMWCTVRWLRFRRENNW